MPRRNRRSYVAKPPRTWRRRYVYKYGRVENDDQLRWLEEIILQNHVYFPRPAELNDPREARPKFVRASLEDYKQMLFRGYIAAHRQLTPEEKADHFGVISFNLDRFGLDWVIKEGERLLHAQLANQRIYSLSKRPNNPYLWEEYAADHRGYCLEFRRTDIFSVVAEVRYRNRVEFNATAEIVNAAFYFYKRRKWSKEEELRIVGQRSPIGYLQFDSKVLPRIFVGRNMTEQNRTTIQEWALKRKPVLVVESAASLVMS